MLRNATVGQRVRVISEWPYSVWHDKELVASLPAGGKTTGLILKVKRVYGRRTAIHVRLDSPGMGIMSFVPSELEVFIDKEIEKA